jgi:hypothetical protein
MPGRSISDKYGPNSKTAGSIYVWKALEATCGDCNFCEYLWLGLSDSPIDDKYIYKAGAK